MQIRTIGRGTPLYVRTGGEFGSTDPLRARLLNDLAPSGTVVSKDRVFGLPTLIQCLRLASHAVAQLEPIIYDESKGEDNRQPATTSWQYTLFRAPGIDGDTRFNLFSDICSGVDGFGNAFVQKVKARVKRKTQVVELKVIPPDNVRAYRKDGRRLFDIMNGGRKVTGLTTDDIVHIRGWNPGGGVAGFSLVEQFKASFGLILGNQDYNGRSDATNGAPGGYISLPEESSDMDRTQLDEILDMWMERHGGLDNAGKPAILKGGAEFKTLPISAQAAQLIEGQQFNVEEMARMGDVPVELLSPTSADTNTTEQAMLRFRILHLQPRIERIRSAFNEDPDLFDGPNSPICLDFNWAKINAADTINLANADLRMRQGGILTANEIRARRGYPPHPDGDELSNPIGAGMNDGGNNDGPTGNQVADK